MTYATKKRFLPYNPKLKERARELRRNSTKSEILLWQHLKSGQMDGYDFVRQRPIDNYIVDFYCRDLMLAIEIDGVSHHAKGEYDLKPQARLEKLGIRIIRFNDEDVKSYLECTLRRISGWIAENKDR